MATSNSIAINIVLSVSFVGAGLLKALSDRWQTTLVVQGQPRRIPHAFTHVFLLWFLKQLLQMSLYLLWSLISKNVFGLGRLMHGQVQQPANKREDPAMGIGFPGHAEAGENENEPGVQGIAGPGPGNIQIGHQDGEDEQDEEDGIEAENVEDEEPPVEEREFGRRKVKSHSKLVYFPPALFDTAHVLLLYFGVKLTYSSRFIMLKGTIGFFIALLSMAFLAQPLAIYVWFGVVFTALGFGSLGLADYVHNTPEGYEKYGIAAGDLLICMSQIMFATKLVYEEKFLHKHSIHPMQFLGCEGIYGCVFAFILLMIFQFVNAVQYSELPNNNVEDIVDACYQFGASWEVRLAVCGSLLMFLIYRYLGMFLVRDCGALPRIMIELFMWALFWGISLAVGWEQTYYISQAPGFVVIFIGLLIYSHILVKPFLLCDRGCQDNIGLEDGPGIGGLGHECDIDDDQAPLLGGTGQDEEGDGDQAGALGGAVNVGNVNDGFDRDVNGDVDVKVIGNAIVGVNRQGDNGVNAGIIHGDVNVEVLRNRSRGEGRGGVNGFGRDDEPLLLDHGVQGRDRERGAQRMNDEQLLVG